MEPYQIALILFVVLIVQIMFGMPIGFALFITGFIGLFITGGTTLLVAVPVKTTKVLTDVGLLAIPMFLLLGTLLQGAGLDTPLYDGLEKWLSWLPGGTAVTTVIGLAWFGTISGSTTATCASLVNVAIPQMRKRGYGKRHTVGVMAGACIGSLIPPSILTIVYGVYTQTSVGVIWIAQVIPAAILVLIFCSYSILTGIVAPTVAPRFVGKVTWTERFRALGPLSPIILLMVFITGSIYSGIVTPSEVGGVAVVFMLIIIVVVAGIKRLVPAVRLATSEALKVTGFIILIIAGAQLFGMSVGYLGAPEQIASMALGHLQNPQLIVMAMMVCYVFLGMIMDVIGMMMLTLPIFLPILTHIGYPVVVFGVLMAVQGEISTITPPVANTLYLVANAAKKYGISMEDCMLGIIPYVVFDFSLVTLLVYFPQIALWLPSTMNR